MVNEPLLVDHLSPRPGLSAPDITVVSRGCHYATSVDHRARSVYADVNCRHYSALGYIRARGPRRRFFVNEKLVRYRAQHAYVRLYMCVCIQYRLPYL